MVYNVLRKIPHYLQSSCLLCQCRIDHAAANSERYFGLCHYCQDDLPFIGTCCRQCSIPLPIDQALCGVCLSSVPAYDSTTCPVSYEKQIPGLVHRFKTRHDNATGRLFSELLLKKILHQHTVIDCIVATPMHWQRNLQRGNNHSFLLAQNISRALALPLSRQLLQRHRPTPVQKTLTAGQRKKNLRNAFYCPKPIDGLSVAVIDDVMTTGSTMNEIAKTLKVAGAREVHCWVIARTPKH